MNNLKKDLETCNQTIIDKLETLKQDSLTTKDEMKLKAELAKEEAEYNLEKFQDKVDWANIFVYQKLSENFICDFQDKVGCWYYISKYQKLSKSFIQRYEDYLDLSFIRDNWIYKSTEEKKWSIILTGKYEYHKDY